MSVITREISALRIEIRRTCLFLIMTSSVATSLLANFKSHFFVNRNLLKPNYIICTFVLLG